MSDTMSPDEIVAYAQGILSGERKLKREELATFMRALLADVPVTEPAKPSPHVTRQDTGAVHVSCSRYFTKAEARDLARSILAAAE